MAQKSGRSRHEGPSSSALKKSSGSVPKEFSPRGVGNKRRSAAMRGKKSSGCLAHRGTLRPFPSGCGVFPPPRPCVAISSIPVCDERQKLFIGGCAVSRKADACCVRKARFSPGRAAKKFCGCVFAAAFSKKNPSAGNRGGIHFLRSKTPRYAGSSKKAKPLNKLKRGFLCEITSCLDSQSIHKGTQQ